jgi:hypothetical protein
MTSTLVTAFFDIKRETHGDGRTIEKYKEWIKETLKLNCNMYIISEPKFRSFFEENMNANSFLKIIDISDLQYYKYYDEIKDIICSQEYITKIKDPNRVECLLPEYNIIQYSKFHCVEMAMEHNPFNSLYFFWVDAGISRFFLDVDTNAPYPNATNFVEKTRDTFIIQKRFDLESYDINENFLWGSDNLLKGTMFGGNCKAIHLVSVTLKDVFEKMIKNKNMNNEQLALSIVWKNNKNLFTLVDDIREYHLILFKLLSVVG